MVARARSNPLHKALRTSLEALPPEIEKLATELLLESTPMTYSVYEPLLLLPERAFDSQEWKNLFPRLEQSHKHAFFARLAVMMKVTHIALNAPISARVYNDDLSVDNVQRRPNIISLHGDFSSFITHLPTKQDFDGAFWVSTRQNGITQTWAPLYTMFSRGNITEKARLLALPSVKSAVEDPRGCTAVDLYAGIGYFAFSYAKAKCVKVLGFELNAWSVEGLRRGAGMNKWTCRVVDTDDLPEDLDLGFEDILTVFEMSNATAADVVERNRSKLPPVRHVNLGLLPTSSGAYEVAVRCLEPNLGGWLHVHENFASRDIIEQAEEVRTQIQKLARDLRGNAWMAELEHVEKVKTYAPGVMHCVLDIHLGPK